jgi:hypothetical protein
MKSPWYCFLATIFQKRGLKMILPIEMNNEIWLKSINPSILLALDSSQTDDPSRNRERRIHQQDLI